MLAINTPTFKTIVIEDLAFAGKAFTKSLCGFEYGLPLPFFRFDSLGRLGTLLNLLPAPSSHLFKPFRACLQVSGARLRITESTSDSTTSI